MTAIAASMLFASQAHAVTAGEVLRDPDLFLGLGFGNFTGDLGNLTSAGIAWNGRVGINPFPWLGGELDYQGMHTSVGAVITGQGVAVSGQAIVQNQITVNAKAGYPFLISEHPLKPYGLLGIGYANVSSNDILTSVGLQSSNACAVPIGVGLEYGLTDIFKIDGRFTYNFLTGSRSTIAPSGDAWNAGINIGAHWGGVGAH